MPGKVYGLCGQLGGGMPPTVQLSTSRIELGVFRDNAKSGEKRDAIWDQSIHWTADGADDGGASGNLRSRGGCGVQSNLSEGGLLDVSRYYLISVEPGDGLFLRHLYALLFSR